MIKYVGFVFFQAEDGIRDLVRSRGLGDVYKRQVVRCSAQNRDRVGSIPRWSCWIAASEDIRDQHHPVSYTHLTLPTSDLV